MGIANTAINQGAQPEQAPVLTTPDSEHTPAPNTSAGERAAHEQQAVDVGTAQGGVGAAAQGQEEGTAEGRAGAAAQGQEEGSAPVEADVSQQVEGTAQVEADVAQQEEAAAQRR